jgi:hypothetical protein
MLTLARNGVGGDYSSLVTRRLPKSSGSVLRKNWLPWAECRLCRVGPRRPTPPGRTRRSQLHAVLIPSPLPVLHRRSPPNWPDGRRQFSISCGTRTTANPLYGPPYSHQSKPHPPESHEKMPRWALQVELTRGFNRTSETATLISVK